MTHSTFSLANRLSPRAIQTLAALVFLLSATVYLQCQSATVPPKVDYFKQLSAARTAYFKGLDGDKEAEKDARQQFNNLQKDHPQDDVVMAYDGSLDLLESARTWALWNKHTLATDGLSKLDAAVSHSPENLEVRFIRAATTYHLPSFFHRRDQAEQDFTFIAPRAEQAASKGVLSPAMAAASLSYYGQVLSDRGERYAARQAYEAAIRVDGNSPAGQDAKKRLGQ